MRVFVTGAPGWLGTRLVEVLAHGFDGERLVDAESVRCLVLPGIDASSIEALGERFEVVRGDVTKPETLAAAVKDVDVVLHLAGIVHPKKPGDFDALNAEGTRTLLDVASRAGAKRLVLISSDAVAGIRAPRTALMEEEDPVEPHGSYGRSKAKAEVHAREFHAAGRIETVILRPFWFYGPHQPPRQTRFFKMIQAGNPVMFGDGRNQRSLSATDNVCDALLRAASVPGAAGETYWIADERVYTSNEIYETIAELLGVKALRPRRIPGLVSWGCRNTDAVLQALGIFVSEIHVAGKMDRDIAGSIEKAKRELGYRPRVGMREGMQRSIEWCRAKGLL
jgi:nucleoside-diphosphate-sugar epimerase